jgi:hypothetical protein
MIAVAAVVALIVVAALIANKKKRRPGVLVITQKPGGCGLLILAGLALVACAAGAMACL